MHHGSKHQRAYIIREISRDLVDTNVLALIAISIAGLFTGLRLTYFRRRILEFQSILKGEVQAIRAEFEAIVHARRRVDRDPDRALNTAERLFNRQSIFEDLQGFYRTNKKFELLGLSTVGILIPFPANVYGTPVIQELQAGLLAHTVIALYTTVIVVVWFFKDYISINKHEKDLGIGEEPSHH